MSELTTNYNLVKPGYADTADIMDINGNMDIIDSAMKGIDDSKQPISDESLNTTDKTVPGAINELADQSAITRFHDEGSSTISMSGSLTTVGEWIKSNFIVNRFIFAKIAPTDSSGYFGSSSFVVLANCSSANYGTAQLMCDNPNKSAIVIGQLIGGEWSWRAVSTEPDIVVEEKSASFSATSGNGSVVISIGKSGYTPIGVVGITGSNTSVLTYSDFYIESSTTAKVYYHCSGSYNITLKVRILYKRNTSVT